MHIPDAKQFMEKLSSRDAAKIYRRVLISCVETSNLSGDEKDDLRGKIRSSDWTSLLGWTDSVVSTEYETIGDHFPRNQIAALIRKYPFTPEEFPFDREAAAWKKFQAAEVRCGETNLRVRNAFKVGTWGRMRSFIAYVLGDFSLSNVLTECGFGPGASVGVGGSATNIGTKFLAESWTVTPSALPSAISGLSLIPGVWELLNQGFPYCLDPVTFQRSVVSKAEIVTYNKIAFVPKTALTDRSIAIEPLLNGFLQKGVDVFMRRRLKRVGIDLATQSLNQSFAQQGSAEWEGTDPYCTIDLSSASDLISTEVVRELLDPEWFSYLDAIRSKNYLDASGEIRRYEKFASMGNGFCFPLETLIFAAAVKAVSPRATPGMDFLVYGDDIVVRKSVFNDVVTLLEELGFTVNKEKTFSTGPFRESCGGDYFGGVNVRPFALDFRLDSLQSLIKCMNLMQLTPLTEIFFAETRAMLLKSYPQVLHFCRPYKGAADTALEVPHDLFMSAPFARWNRALQSWEWYELSTTPKADRLLGRKPLYPIVLNLGALHGLRSQCPFTLRRQTRIRPCKVCNAGASSTYLPPTRL